SLKCGVSRVMESGNPEALSPESHTSNRVRHRRTAGKSHLRTATGGFNHKRYAFTFGELHHPLHDIFFRRVDGDIGSKFVGHLENIIATIDADNRVGARRLCDLGAVEAHNPLAKDQDRVSQGNAEGSYVEDAAGQWLNRGHFPICHAVRHLGQRIERYSGIFRETAREIKPKRSSVRVRGACGVPPVQAILVLSINVDNFSAKFVTKQLL